MILDYITNKAFLSSLYPNGFKNQDWIISDVAFSWNGPSVAITLHCSQLPENRPKKWDTNTNMVCLKLEFFDISNLSFKNWGRDNKCLLTALNIQEEGYRIIVKGNDCDLEFSTKFIYFKSINPYLNEE